MIGTVAWIAEMLERGGEPHASKPTVDRIQRMSGKNFWLLLGNAQSASENGARFPSGRTSGISMYGPRVT